MSYFKSLLNKLKNKKKVIASAAAFTFFAAWVINNIKKSGPHNTTSYILSGGVIGSPKLKTGERKIDNKQIFNDLKSVLADYIRHGQDIGTQISVFIKNKEQLNYYAVDKNRFPDYNVSSLHTIFSSTKNISALLIAIAVNNKWINSYDDNIHKYWPEFPTKSQFFKVTKDNKGNRKLIFEDCENEKYLTISDILRHEGGLDRLWGNDKILYLKKSGLNDVKQYIQDSNLCYRKYDSDGIPKSNRFYHALMRGLILNELFRRTEPKHRSMNEYFKQEIAPILSENDNDFKVYLKGKSMKDKSKVYHIENSNILWILYHIIAPFIFGIGHLPKKHYFNKYLYTDIKYSNFQRMRKLSDLNRITSKENNYAPDWTKFRRIKSISKQFENENDIKMEWMSATGISNAHSMSKLLSYFLFNNNTNITKGFHETVKEMISEPKMAYDATILSMSQFTKGGFNKVTLYDITWYLWGGLGGSWYAFSPKYQCTFAYTVIGFNRLDLNMCCSETEQHVGKEPRGNVVFYYLSKYLKSLS
eukprot:331081_1